MSPLDCEQHDVPRDEVSLVEPAKTLPTARTVAAQPSFPTYFVGLLIDSAG